MSTGLPAAREPRASLPERLLGYSRYLALVAEALHAVEQHDEPRLRALQQERLRLARELAEVDEDAPLPPPHLELYALLRAGLEEIEAHAGQEEHERALWGRLESGALRAAHSLGPPLPRSGVYRAFAGPDKKFDVRL